MPQTFYEVLWIFIIYAFIGWSVEVSYAALDRGIFVNRGFFNGPYCPIYGIGVLIVVTLLTPLKGNLWLLFLGSFFLTSLLEYLTGYILEKVFHNKWWDYSDKPFNIKGYVCLKFSIAWGIACTFIMQVVHPIIYKFIQIIPKTLGIVTISIIMAFFAADAAVTINTILKFNRRLKLMSEIAGRLKTISNEIGENIYENVTEVIEKKEQIEEKVEEKVEAKKEEYEDLQKRYKALAEKKIYGHERLLKAFPGMSSDYYEDALSKLKEHIQKIKNTAENRRNKE